MEGYIKDYKLKISKAVRNKRIIIYLKAGNDLKELLRRAIILDYKEDSIFDGSIITRAKIKKPIFNNLNMRTAIYLFQKEAVESNWDTEFEFNTAQDATRFLQEIPEVISIIASVFEKYDKEVQNGS